jgi:hypothetical protein
MIGKSANAKVEHGVITIQLQVRITGEGLQDLQSYGTGLLEMCAEKINAINEGWDSVAGTAATQY